MRSRWLPIGLAAAGLAGSLALLGERDSRWYAEVAPPLLVGLLGGSAALIVWLVQLAVVARDRGSAARRADVDAEINAAVRASRTRLIARLDHEIKNPVTAIRAGLANVPVTEVSPLAGAALASIDDQARRLSRLVTDLRRLGELESVEIEQADVDLAEVANEVAAAAADLPGAGDRDVQVIVPKIPWRVSAVRGDRDLIFLAAMNLVSNAVKFTAPGGSIELRALEEDSHAVIEVADTGIGIPDTERELVWEELSRGEAARAVPGSGIGLALARTIVQRHGGDVSLRSRPGRGTVVRLRFPMP